MFTLEQSLAVFGDLYREVTGRISSAHVLKADRDRAREQHHPPEQEPASGPVSASARTLPGVPTLAASWPR